MFHPQGFYPQGFYPQGFYPQGFYSQGFHPQGSAGYFANTLYGLPQHPPVQGPTANWQPAAQQAIQQLLGQQLAAQLGVSNAGGAGVGWSNGAGTQVPGVWQQQNHPGQINPALQQQSMQQPLFQQLSQYHYAIAQQLSQLAAQPALPLQGMGGSYTGQFIPGQTAPFIPTAMGGSFVPGFTMH
jgi:hypothetical protein